jgi:hypothetical protein
LKMIDLVHDGVRRTFYLVLRESTVDGGQAATAACRLN